MCCHSRRYHTANIKAHNELLSLHVAERSNSVHSRFCWIHSSLSKKFKKMNYSPNASIDNNSCFEAALVNEVEPRNAWILGGIGGTAAILNALMITLIASDPTLRSKRHVWLILNQCVSDCWNGCVVMLTFMVDNGSSWSVSQRTHEEIITSSLRQNGFATSFWRSDDVIIASWDATTPGGGRQSTIF